MADQLSPSARRVQEALLPFGREFVVVELPASTRTARDAATAVACDVAQIAKALVFRTKETNRPVLVIASGANRVNEARLAELVGEAVVKADADFVRERTGFAIGGVPPLGHTEVLFTLIDEDLQRFDEIWAAAGTPNALFRLHPNDLPQITGGRTAAVK